VLVWVCVCYCVLVSDSVCVSRCYCVLLCMLIRASVTVCYCVCHTQYSYLSHSNNITESVAPNLHAMVRGTLKFRHFRDILTLCTSWQTRDVLVAVSEPGHKGTWQC
jgi:hypothetical protein